MLSITLPSNNSPCIRESSLFKLTDGDHHTLEFFEDRGGTEVRTMEIKYTRKN